MQLKASAPGSLMLLGEYAVLYGKHALACAIDKRIYVTITPNMSNRITIHSSLYETYETELSQLKIEKPFNFVLGVLQYYQAKLKSGCDIHIVSDFSDKVGLGSSAAVTVATIAALLAWLNIKISPHDLVRHGRNIIRQIQGVGSGTDIAASVYGGMIGYQTQPLLVEKFSIIHPLVVLYSGFKTPTVEAIKKVQTDFSSHSQLFNYLIQSIGQCAFEGIQHVRKSSWYELGKIMNVQQGLMAALGVNTLLIQHMVENLRQQSTILGAKISGSGLGDCVVGLGELPSQYAFALGHISSVSRISLNMTLQGVVSEKV
jgi:mevalonate kinase